MAPVPTRTSRLLLAWILALAVLGGTPAAAGAHYGTHGAVQGIELEQPGSELTLDSQAEPFQDAVAEASGAAAGRLAASDWRTYPTLDGTQLRIAVSSEYEGTGIPEQIAGADRVLRARRRAEPPVGDDHDAVGRGIGVQRRAARVLSALRRADGGPRRAARQRDAAGDDDRRTSTATTSRPTATTTPGRRASGGRSAWATVEGVCGGVAAGTAFPGAGGEQYWSNPGEAFAQAYAFMHYPGEVPWWWHIAEPDAAAYEAIRADVEQPWAPTWSKVGGRLAKRHGTESFAQETPLDGRFTATLRGPRDAKYDLVLRSADGTVIDRTRGDGARDELKAQVCGVRSVSLEVVRKDGDGRFRVRPAQALETRTAPAARRGPSGASVPARRE